MLTNDAQRPNLYIQRLVFNNDESVEIQKGDIVVFVGPNNVGKSRLLKDIFDLAGMWRFPVVLKEISCTEELPEKIVCWFDKHLPVVKDRFGRVYSGYNLQPIGEKNLKCANANGFDKLRGAVICFLNTESRLLISRPAEGIEQWEAIKSPIHALVRDAGLLKKVADYIKKAFGTSIAPRLGKTVPLCIGPDISKEEIAGETMQEVEANYLKRLKDYPQLQDQGDGMRSFIGIVLWLILEHYNIYLIDEPETFLHPPQATLIGNVVGDLISEERQAFVATHSIHFINGLLDKVPNRVKIIRVTRTGDANDFSILDNTRLLQISKDPFLRYSALLEGMFYKNVVLCEGDADCMFYSMLNSAADMKGVKGTETLFTHCGGKQRMSKVIGALKELKVDIKVIPDFDVLNNESILKELVQVCGGEWGQIDRDYNVLISDIKQRANVGETGADILKKISAELSDAMEIVVSQTKMRNIREMLSSNTEWDRLKEAGVSGIGAGNPCQSCKAVLSYLATIGIHVVHCGELERFVPVIGGHGQNWLHAVLDKYPDVSDSVYNAAKDFVRSWRL